MEQQTTAILVIGAGGIGGLLTLHVSRAIAFSQWPHGVVEITLMDGDIVEERNLPHQQFTPEDIGKPKVYALERYDCCCNQSKHIQFIPNANNFSSDTNLLEYDLVVVAVDREEPRQLVREKANTWLELRSTGDGCLMWSHMDDIDVLNLYQKLPPGESASCQHENAVESGNIQFGFALAAAHGAQWIIQWLRNSLTPSCRTYSIHNGELPIPEIDSPSFFEASLSDFLPEQQQQFNRIREELMNEWNKIGDLLKHGDLEPNHGKNRMSPKVEPIEPLVEDGGLRAVVDRFRDIIQALEEMAREGG